MRSDVEAHYKGEGGIGAPCFLDFRLVVQLRPSRAEVVYLMNTFQ